MLRQGEAACHFGSVPEHDHDSLMTFATRVPRLVVGIGASAGGLEAVAELLGALPADAGVACIVVQHLDPKHESLLAEILKKTALPVSVARSGEMVEPDHVYVIPPDVILSVRAGRIELTPRSSGPEPSLPVDVLFTPATAHFSDMPRQAIETGCVDLVLSPNEIAKDIGRLAAPVRAGHQRRVLIVDDHEELRQSLGRLVRAFGHEVAIARDGPSALALAESFQPDAAIVDVSLEGMSGIELGRRLRELFPRERLSLIALTGFASEDIRQACFAAGFDAHLVKPGEIPKLEQLLGGVGLDAAATR